MTAGIALRRTGNPGAEPVTDEVAVAGPAVSGALPAELDGTYLRIGPNPLRPGARTSDSPFVGDGMVHGLRLRDGRAEWYRNRWIRTDRACRALGVPPLPGPRHGLCDNANAGILRHHGKTFALGNGGVLPIELDGELDSLWSVDFDGTLPNGFVAHPQRDPVTDELFAVVSYPELPCLQYLVLGPDGRVRRREPISVTGTPMQHALSLTERHVLIYDLPVLFDRALSEAGSRCPYSWRTGRPARLGVLPRSGGDADVRWFDVDPCFVFHPVNAYETGDRVVIDVIRHDRAFDGSGVRSMAAAPTLWRWCVDLRAGTVTTEQLDDTAQESPRIDDRRGTVPHRYAYTLALSTEPGIPFGGKAIIKHDCTSNTATRHEFGPGREAGEAVFVPRGPFAAEDDGWLLSFVYDRSTDRSDLVVLDAGDVAATPRAVVHLPVRVPHGFHAEWLPAGW
ncbi:MAG TPA: carotenoid oxygenase family protein [Kutzneria sp.]